MVDVLKASPAALQYGPFFFALLFVLFVPVLGHQWFSSLIKSNTGAAAERDAAIQMCKFYWKSGIVVGLILVFAACAWWMYNARLDFEREVKAESASRSFEGVINETRAEDELLFEPYGADYEVLFNPENTKNLPLTRYAVLFKSKPKGDEQIKLFYVNRTQASGIATPLQLCIAKIKNTGQITLAHNGTGITLQGAC